MKGNTHVDIIDVQRIGDEFADTSANIEVASSRFYPDDRKLEVEIGGAVPALEDQLSFPEHAERTAR